MISRTKKNERGVAMLIVLFSVLLLSVIGLGMMYSTNMETSINSNYRDKQSAFYAALAGLQEARDRIQPATHNIVAPSQLPSTSAANIIYIVSNYATVNPWLTSSRYFDTELCQERVLSIPVGTPGNPCTSIASGTTWLSYVDDSQSSSAPWNITHPLDLKWVRIQLKANNNTPVPVNGDATNADQTCWTGTNQMSTPTGYTTGCHPIGGVTAVMMATSGTGYTTPPTVTLVGGGGTGATATAVLAPELTGYIASITLTTGGAHYTNPPTVTISGGVGSGATATAVLSTTPVMDTEPGAVTAVSLTTGGTYTSAPIVTLSGGGGTGAAAIAVLGTSGTVVTTGYVDSIASWTGGTGYTSAPTINFNGGGGTGAAATATLGTTGVVKTITLASAGTQCYSQASDVVISFSGGGGGTGAAATATLETTRSCIYSVSIPSPTPKCTLKLTGVDHQDNVSFASGDQSGFGTLYVSNADNKSPTGYTVVNPGNGYTTSPIGPTNLQLVSGSWTGGGDCSNLQGTITTGYHIASITLTNSGSGYASDPTVTISGGVGSTSQPTATVTRGFPITAITLTDGGSGYTSTPTISFTGGGGGSGATATAHITMMNQTVYPVISVNVTAGGTGYASAPTVSFSGGGGSGAVATANVSAETQTTYSVASVTVDTGGMDYNPANPPTITFSGGGGSGAAGVPVISTMNSGTYFVHHIDVNTNGTGYTSDPAVNITGGGGTGATAVSQVSGGTKYGKVWLLTSFAATVTGARSLLQMEVASPVMGFAPGGALTLDGPNPVMDAVPNSDNFVISGYDTNSCAEVAEPVHPAIDGYDDPNAPTPTSSVEIIKASLPRPDHYTGSGGTPSVQNGFGPLGETMTTPTGLNALIGAIYNTTGAVHYDDSNSSHFQPTDTNLHSITYVDGDLTLNGNATGEGILVVTGHLTMGGDFHWNGLIFVVGDGSMDFAGGGTGQINGMLFVAKIWDGYMTKNLLSSMGSPSFHWNGGGNNGVRYDHCLSTNLMTAVQFDPPPSTKPLKILSLRILPY
jgi:hypothetical protein